jgi:Outer membrane protein beta-barrel domain
MHRSLYLFCVCSVLNGVSVAFPLFPLSTGMGPYVGLQFGETSNHYSLSRLGLRARVHYQGFSGRAHLGYQFNPYIGMETGILRFTPARVRGINGDRDCNGNIKDYDIDLLLAGNLGFNNGYYIFGKFGVGYHRVKPSALIRQASTSIYANYRIAHYRPVVSLGIGYALTRRLGLDASYMEVFKHRAMARGTLWALGLTYYFKDYYCGRTLFC